MLRFNLELEPPVRVGLILNLDPERLLFNLELEAPNRALEASIVKRELEASIPCRELEPSTGEQYLGAPDRSRRIQGIVDAPIPRA